MNIFVGIWWWEKSPTFLPHMVSAGPAPAADCFPGSYSTALENSRRSCLGASSGGELGQVQQEGHATTGEETQKMWGRSMCQHDAFFSYTTAKWNVIVCYSLLVYLIPKLGCCKESRWMDESLVDRYFGANCMVFSTGFQSIWVRMSCFYTDLVRWLWWGLLQGKFPHQVWPILPLPSNFYSLATICLIHKVLYQIHILEISHVSQGTRI